MIFDAGEEQVHTMSTEKKFAYIFGVLFMGILAYAGLRQGAAIDERQFFFLRVIAAISAAGVAAVIPGFIEFKNRGPHIAIRAGGAIAVFAIVFSVNPPALLHTNEASPAETFKKPEAKSEPSTPMTTTTGQRVSGSVLSDVDLTQKKVDDGPQDIDLTNARRTRVRQEAGLGTIDGGVR